VYHKQYEEFLNEIRNIGVVHIIEKPFEETQTLKANKSLLNEYSSTISALKKRLKAKNIDPESLVNTENTEVDGLTLLEEFKNYQQRLEYNNQKLAALKKELSAVEPWGDYDLHRIESLSRNNLSFRFFIASKQKFKPEWENQYPIEVLTKRVLLFTLFGSSQ
jgi:V/A-type H+-transporting ATPase subunit I